MRALMKDQGTGDFTWLNERLDTQKELLEDAHRRFALEADQEFAQSTASEWLLDNYHIVQETRRQIREDLPKKFYRQLPKKTLPPFQGKPRIYGVAREAVQACQGELDIEELKRFITGYQESAILNTGELWALPVMLRLLFLDDLARAAGRITGIRTPTEIADPEPLTGLDTVSDEARISRAILSLRALAAQDWKDFFEAVSLVERILVKDPSKTYGRMDFESRDRYRKIIEVLAAGSGWDETEVARKAVHLAEAHPGNPSGPESRSHVGYYLLGAGRAHLESRLGFRPSFKLRLRRWLLHRPTLLYLGSIGTLALLIESTIIGVGTGAGAAWYQLATVFLLTLIPAVTTATTVMNWAFTRMISPDVLPKLDFRDGIPADCRTVAVIPALLSDADEVDSLIRQLELHYLGNSDPRLFFALLTDLADAEQKETEPDRALIEQAIAGIEGLNRRYGKTHDRKTDHLPFFLFHRERLWNPAEGKWMGWERKRGKLDEFNRLLSGSEKTSFAVQIGDTAALSKIRYVITLDADTQLPRETARRLIGTLAHPLNRLRVDPQTGEGSSGYTILQPRTEVRPVSANRSLFSKIFSGSTGLDLYSSAASDVYQDLFGEGIYTGKGIYDISAFECLLFRRTPENTLLSHDLFEGLHVRVGLATDIVLLEDYPPSYPVYARRLHRWVRGDWQLLPWLLFRKPHPEAISRPYRLSLISRWKILDNLIRSLFQPSILVLLIAGWLVFPGSAFLWTLLALLMSAAPLALQMAAELPGHFRARRSPRNTAAALRVSGTRWLLMLTFLPYESAVALDAVFRTVYRIGVSRRRLLEWTTSSQTARGADRRSKPGWYWQQMWSAPVAALGIALLLAAFHAGALFGAAPLLTAWFFSPYVAYRISRPISPEPEFLEIGRRYQVRRLARRTWFFFEQFVGPEDHWLPPDHFQESPLGLVAHRTSPTNIGLLLLSTAAAYDLGYIGLPLLSARLRNTLDGLEQLETYRGHVLNWFDTRNLHPLSPRYVSAVDSGNLAACLLTLRQACLRLGKAPVLRWERWQGLLDTFDVLDEIVAGFKKEASEAVGPMQAQWDHIRGHVVAVRTDPDRWFPLLNQLEEIDLKELNRRLERLIETDRHLLNTGDLNSLRLWTERVHYQLRTARREIQRLAPWLPALDRAPALPETGDGSAAAAWQGLTAHLPLMPALEEVESVCESGLARLSGLRTALIDLPASEDRRRALEWCAETGEGFASARENARYLLKDFEGIARQSEEMADAMDFTFLFNPRRQLFRIGYNVDAGMADPNHYDLMASEARIASLVAIAKGDIPQSHWLHLSRPMTRVDDTRCLLSWSGSMFEYLLPRLLMRENETTLLGQSGRAAVARQIEYGRQKKVPWGISESAYHRFNADMHYQYRAFGVPGLGYKRRLEDDLVIAPYASLLALPIRPNAVLDNIAALREHKALGNYGFYEAVDFTPSRLALGEKQAVIRSFYAHHQGMIFLSLAHYLTEGRMVDRFHQDPRIQSVELLLQEKIPEQAPLEELREAAVIRQKEERPKIELNSWPVPVHGPVPHGHLLSNGRYSLFITGSGSGFSRWKETALTRWRADTTLEDRGTWFYVRDQENDALWSAAYQPTGTAAKRTEAHFSPHRVDFRTEYREIVLHTEITVPPEDAVEIRRVTITNRSPRKRRLFLASYGEVVLAPQEMDRRHPAFNKLFLESRYLNGCNGLLYQRRPRSSEEAPVFLIHGLVVPAGMAATGAYESDRRRFLGRGRTIRNPIALSGNGPGLTGTAGATLDPIFSLGQAVELEPNQMVQLSWFTLAADSRDEALAAAERCQNGSAFDAAIRAAESQSRSELHQLTLSSPELASIQKLLSVLLHPHPALRADPAILSANTLGQSGLWPHAISGDYPILLLRIAGEEEIGLVHQVLQAHAYWRSRRLKIDLVILNLKETGYTQEVQGQLQRLLMRTNSDAWLNRRGGIFILRADQIEEADRILLSTAARAILDGSRGMLADQLEKIDTEPVQLPAFNPEPIPEENPPAVSPISRPDDLLFDNGLGGFSPDGREYILYLKPGEATPAPWINVIANPEFGFIVSESGSGNTWSVNSGENRLTPWHNDPVSDPTGEALYLRDEETAAVWTPAPLPAGPSEPFLIRHGAGYTEFEHHSHGLRQRMRLFAAAADPVKLIQIRLENAGRRVRRITAAYYAEWVLGPDREEMQPYIISTYDEEVQALFARNPYHTEFGGRAAFLSADRSLHGLTGSRSEFLGRMGDFRRPAALGRIGLADNTTAGIDPCGAVQVHINLQPGEVQEVTFLLGQGADRPDAQRIVREYRNRERIDAAWTEMTGFWDDLLGAVTVKTPDTGMDLLLNRWLVYQNLSCRIWGRSALYQSSGAFGFRDQLQDVMGILLHRPEIARVHILRAARHQFEAGDVLHWWHPPSGRGVRTRISDDLLWLPYVTARYVKATGDESILSEKVPFLQGKPLEPEEEERYGHYEPTAEGYSLYEHGLRAIRKASTRGRHGLPLIGAGDWNDGMNRVGIQGRGESTWLGWFLYAAATEFADLCRLREDGSQAEALLQAAGELRQNLETAGWDGDWYLRGFYDDGAPLGSSQSEECQIDSIAQSWSVLSGAGDPSRRERAMEAVAARLVEPDDRLVRLFTPPFDQTPKDPGYIKGYPPGIRENGGQYTHAATWAVWAFAELGRGDQAGALFSMLNPIHHADTPEKVGRYQVEPYVIAADVYSMAPHAGRGGWTWYTGSGGWMYRLGVEAILGLRREGHVLRVVPSIPSSWPEYRLTYRYGRAVYHIHVLNPEGVSRGIRQVLVDGVTVAGGDIPLEDKNHRFEVTVKLG